jgi:MFS family permease
MVYSAFTWSYGISQIPAGWLADRIDRRIPMVIGICGLGLAGVLVGLSQTYTMLIVFLVLMGVLGGGYHPSATPWFQIWLSRRKGVGLWGFMRLAAVPVFSWYHLSPLP